MTDRRIPVSTYRLQLHRGFTFTDARRVVPYLSRLGVTDLYLSPYLAARPGSTHGYDICDHGRLNPELGGEDGFDELVAELATHGMGHILDFVPNHMGIDAAFNPWWRDLLENGPSSPFARYFDVEWDPVKPEMKQKILLPILGAPYGEVLERGELRLEYHEGTLRLRYFDHDLPVNPRQIPRVLRMAVDPLRARLGEGDPRVGELAGILAAMQNLPVYTESAPERIARRHREKEIVRDRLSRLVDSGSEVREEVDAAIRSVNGIPGEPSSFDQLHELLEAEPYRLAYWRTAFHEINYRRFFDINDLGGLRMEDPEVFEAAHRLVLRLVGEGKITGLRLDHLDGLFDPEAYLRRLRDSVGDLYVVVEKILSAGESLPASWPVEGTSGYDFLNELNGVFVDEANGKMLRRFYERFTGRTAPFAIVTYVGKRLITQTAMASELNVLAHALNRVSERDRRSRDFTLESLREALRELVACFPVYRTYVSESGWTEGDREIVDRAILAAQRRNPAMEASIFDFIRAVLLPDPAGVEPDEHRRRLELAMRFQQYTSPVQAKGVEDTAFYRYFVLASLNEVGGEPHRFGRPVSELHESNRRRRAQWPHAMLATATHDTKRGEDGRARINVLSEMPREWRAAVSRWARLNASRRARIDGQWAPDRNEEYLFYQTLIGAWPNGHSGEADAELVRRLREYLVKALREAKLHTSWTNVNEAWEQAVGDFAERTLTGAGARKFLPAFLPFQQVIARLGVINSLSQLALKMASPGVPDFYQGSELWDLSLVDPDNRRPVDFARRAKLLEEMPEAGDASALAAMLDSSGDGRIKLWLTAQGMRLRRRHPDLFLYGDYVPLLAEGELSAHVVAFSRSAGDSALVVVVPRLPAGLARSGTWPPLGAAVWKDCRLRLPESLGDRRFRSVLTGDDLGPGTLPVAAALRTCPVAYLVSTGGNP